MNEAPKDPAVAIISPAAPVFTKLRTHLGESSNEIVLHELASASAAIEKAGAKHAAARLLQLDDYATVLPPEALPRLLDPASILDELEETTSKWLGRWILLRNIFALFPLLITWFSLSVATSAYRDEIRQNPNQVYQPFLVLWENGFDHRMWLTFSLVAGIDTVLFIMIIGMTAIIHALEHGSHSRAQQLAARVDRAVAALVAALGEERWRATNNPGEWAPEVRRVIERAMQETRELNKANQQALESAKMAIQEAKQSHTELIRELGGEVVRTLDAVRAENTRLLQLTAQELGDMLAQAFAGQKQVAEESLAAVTEARRATEHASERAQATFAELKRESVDALRSLHEADRGFLVDIGRETRDLLQRLGSQVGTFHESASMLAGSVGQVGDVAIKLGENAGKFADSARVMDEHVAKMTASQERFAGKLAETAEATRGAVDHVNTATRQMQETTTQLHDLLVAVSSTLSPQLQHLGAQVRSASDALSQTQSRLAETSDGLARAAEYFRNMPRPKVIVTLFGKSST